jgi:RNA polymerase sigma factor (TIGR02999 family)
LRAKVNSDRDLTGLLQAWRGGDTAALETLAALVQLELREMARRMIANERRDGRWQPTELVQEAYLRLLDWRGVEWRNRAHFFATVAQMMRHVLVDAARAGRAAKRGDGAEVVPIDRIEIPAPAPPVDVVALAEALESLASLSTRASRVVELRFFGGWSVEETAEALDVSVRTVINDWNMARAWLHRELSHGR